MSDDDFMMDEDSFVVADDDFGYDEDSDVEYDAPVLTKGKSKSTAGNKSVLSNADVNVPKGSTSKTGKTVEEIYQKKTQKEHILLRPDTYGKSLDWKENGIHVFGE